MTFRKFPLALLIFSLGVGCAYAKKQPKYGQARQLTAEQAALVQRAIAQEKVLIKNIQQRTPLVETYIQDTRPDVKLYAVPIADHYMLSRVDFGKTFFDKTYMPSRRRPGMASSRVPLKPSRTSPRRCTWIPSSRIPIPASWR